MNVVGWCSSCRRTVVLDEEDPVCCPTCSTGLSKVVEVRDDGS